MSIQKAAFFSKCKKYRYALWRIWDTSKPIAMFVSLNPSEIEENEDDATILKCAKLASENGFGGIINCNLFAIRTNSPEEFLNVQDVIGPENDIILLKFAKQAHSIIAAWGPRGSYMDRHKRINQIFPKLSCFGISKGGQPEHILAVAENADLIPYQPPK